MTRESYLREKILELGTVKEFAEKIDMPYTTLLSILKNVGGASINNVIKICAGLGISADMLAEIGEEITIPSETKGYYTDPEAAQGLVCSSLPLKISLKRRWKKQSNT